MHVLVTGAKGFVGSALLRRFQQDSSIKVTGTVRSLPDNSPPTESLKVIGNIGPDTDWSAVLQGVDVIVHLAARAHVLNDRNTDPLAEFRRVNVDAALTLARQAILEGVRRFVFISSIGVNGSVTEAQPFSERSVPFPHADYAQSKFEAEEALKLLVAESAMELVIIRPPLVYAADAPGNFKRLLRLVASGVPMPFGMIDNKRSLVALDNLVDFIVHTTHHSEAANEVFLVSDGVDVSTPEMVRLLAKGMEKRLILLPVPQGLLGMAASVMGKKGLYTQLCCSLQVDSDKAQTLLGWTPPVHAHSALMEAGRVYKQLH